MIDVVPQVEPSDINTDAQDLSNITVIDISTGQNTPGGAAALNTARLECVGVLKLPQSHAVATNAVANPQIITLDDTKSVLIVNNGNAQNDYFLISQVNEGVQTGNVLHLGLVNLVAEEAMTSHAVMNLALVNAPTNKGTQTVSVTNPGVVNTTANRGQENGQKKDQTLYTLKAVVESETDNEKQNDQVTNASKKSEAFGSEEERHSADDILTVGHAVIGNCSKECKTNSELECFGVLKYNIKDGNDTAQGKSLHKKAGTISGVKVVNESAEKKGPEFSEEQTDTRKKSGTDDSDESDAKKDIE